jgi:asparagine synthase (glutamine-hydrolysing)
MCGIVGFIGKSIRSPEDIVRRMSAALVHRGPDDAGFWMDQTAGLALGHQRLSIIDLSPAGHQPMHSHCGRYTIVFNGEIYNFEAIRRRLRGGSGLQAWRGHSDTEVFLAAISAWGLERALDSVVGMFAFALWDQEERALHLARDRLGEKPLYHGVIANSFVFGSELKALRAFPNSGMEVNRSALAELLQFGYIPAPYSIYGGIRKLESGKTVTIRVGANGDFRTGEPRSYWSINRSDLAERRREYAARDDESLVDELHKLLAESVRQQSVADVPLGAFLSGGIDSSTIVALMQAHSSRPVRTFTIGFHEKAYNEAHHAKAVARHLGTDHTELYVTPREAASIIPRLPQIYDEPFADSSQIPTFLVAELTRRHVTVSLSGDGGDELFGGYPRYLLGESLWRSIRRMPRWSRRATSHPINMLSAQNWDRVLAVLPNALRTRVTGRRLHRFTQLLNAGSFDQMYLRLISQWQDANEVVLNAAVASENAGDASVWSDEGSSLNRMRGFDVTQYLPDDLLVKVDRATMAVGLESRAPLLDHRVVEFAWGLPERVLVREGQGKWILRRVLDSLVPHHLVDRPKSGFGIPLGQWLRGGLREWAEHLLDERALRAQGFLNPVPVRSMWNQHLSGGHNREAYLWNVLMFQAWLDRLQIPTGNEAIPVCAA